MDIQDSIQHVLQSQDLVAERFYERYFTSHPEVKPYFANTDMKRQAVMLTMALMLIQRHSEAPYPVTDSYLKVLGHTHASRRNIPAEHFGSFRDCLIDTLAHFHGDDWNEGLAAQWRDALNLTIATMLKGYEKAYTV